MLHTGDFKLDHTPIDGVRIDFAALRRWADEGVDLLMCDSTNATRKGFTPTEAEVGASLRDVSARQGTRHRCHVLVPRASRSAGLRYRDA